MPNKPPQCELLRATDLLLNPKLKTEQQVSLRFAICGGCAIQGWMQTQVQHRPLSEEQTLSKAVIMDDDFVLCPKLPDLQGNGIEYTPLMDLQKPNDERTS